MEWWQGFWGWAVTALLSGVAAIGVMIEIVSRRRGSYVQFEVGDRGTVTRPDGERWHLFTLANVGTMRAFHVLAWVVRAEQKHDGLTYAIPDVFSPGDRQVFAIVGDPSKAYIRVLWLAGQKRAHVSWWPLDVLGELGQVRVEQVRAIRRRWWRPWRRFRNGPVGPVDGGVAHVPVRGASDRSRRLIEVALSAA